MEELTKKVVEFADERGWLQYNTPENLAKSISIEAAELLECFQWTNDYKKDEVKYELADVMNYCIMMCYQIGVDPKEVILEKMAITGKKYPIERSNKETDSTAKINDYKSMKNEFRKSQNKED